MILTLSSIAKINRECLEDIADGTPWQEANKTATFTQYALAAAEEALTDAGWKPTNQSDLKMTGV